MSKKIQACKAANIRPGRVPFGVKFAHALLGSHKANYVLSANYEFINDWFVLTKFRKNAFCNGHKTTIHL